MQNPFMWHCLGMHEDVKNGNIMVWCYTKGKTPRYWGRWIDSPSQGIHETRTLQFPQVFELTFYPWVVKAVSSFWSMKLSSFLTQLMHFNVVCVLIVELGGGGVNDWQQLKSGSERERVCDYQLDANMHVFILSTHASQVGNGVWQLLIIKLFL